MLLAVLVGSFAPQAASANPSGEDLRTIISSGTHTEYEWWLITWADNQIACSAAIYHEGLPRSEEIQNICGERVHTRWSENPVCQAAQTGGPTSNCAGLYLMLKGTRQVQYEIVTTFPPATISVSLLGCEAVSRTHRCSAQPKLHLEAFEPIAGESISQIVAKIGGKEFTFAGNTADVSLDVTSVRGQEISFWADSTLGDSTEPAEALYRVVINENSAGWFVDVLSSNWVGSTPAAFAAEWRAFPSLENPAQWLAPSALATDEPYLYLAGQLIRWGIADASVCGDGGMLWNGYASQCGLDHAHVETASWQNRFDRKILQVAEATQIPAQLMKNIIAQETQFWPGYYAPSPDEFGLARLTEWGAETILMWDLDFYQTICSRVFTANGCAVGFSEQSPESQALLRGTLIRSVDAYCESCAYQIDLQKAELDIEVLSHSLLANAAQVNQLLMNLGDGPGGKFSSYEDLWRFTVANYNVGPGCLAESFEAVLTLNLPVNWETVSANLKNECRNAIEYVDGVTRDRWGSDVVASAESVGG